MKTRIHHDQSSVKRPAGRHPNFPVSNAASNPLCYWISPDETADRGLFLGASQKELKSTRLT